MGLKVHKYSEVTQNLIIFLLLSIFFLHINISFDRGLSALNIDALKEVFFEFPILNILLFGSFFSIIRAKKYSKTLLALFFIHISVYSFFLFFKNFDKIILVLNFFYIVFSFYFYINWSFELKKAVYLPSYTPYDIGNKTYYDLRGKVVSNKSGQKVSGYIVNWDQEGCFFYSEDPILQDFRGKLTIEIDYEGLTFTQKAEIVTSYYGGKGIKFLLEGDSKKSRYTWNDFFKIIGDRGFSPLYSRK
ncbi:MAG: hypothetical protein VXW15_12000 [Bdellovibrionota bacterium]|nr:hypothetical protein [Bdellovibrionota bacterium]